MTLDEEMIQQTEEKNYKEADVQIYGVGLKVFEWIR
jgi:hypothetical protein